MRISQVNISNYKNIDGISIFLNSECNSALKHEYVYCTNIGLAGSDKIFFSQIPIDKAQGVMR
jgi:hypothetical protein